MARLKDKYFSEIRPQLKEELGYKNIEQVPKLEKIVLNMGVGEAKQNTSMLDAAVEQLALIAGQNPSIRLAKKSVAAFKVREGMPVGIAVTMRHERMYELFDRITTIAIPRIRDFRGMNPRSFDGRGNYSFGIKEQIVFPEIDYDSIDQVRGLDVTITTTAANDEDAQALLSILGFPFKKIERTEEDPAKGGGAGRPQSEPEEVGEASDESSLESDDEGAAEPVEDEAQIETGDGAVETGDGEAQESTSDEQGKKA